MTWTSGAEWQTVHKDDKKRHVSEENKDMMKKKGKKGVCQEPMDEVLAVKSPRAWKLHESTRLGQMSQGDASKR